MLLQLPGAAPATRLSPRKKDITSHLLHPAASPCLSQNLFGTTFPQTNFLLHLKFPVSHLTAPRPPGLLIGLNFVARQLSPGRGAPPGCSCVLVLSLEWLWLVELGSLS